MKNIIKSIKQLMVHEYIILVFAVIGYTMPFMAVYEMPSVPPPDYHELSMACK